MGCHHEGSRGPWQVPVTKHPLDIFTENPAIWVLQLDGPPGHEEHHQFFELQRVGVVTERANEQVFGLIWFGLASQANLCCCWLSAGAETHQLVCLAGVSLRCRAAGAVCAACEPLPCSAM